MVTPLGPGAVVGTVFASHHQFFLRDAAFGSVASDIFDGDEAEARGLAVDPRGWLRIFTVSYETVPVAMEAASKPPTDDLRSWLHVSEASIAVPSGMLVVDGILGDDPNIRLDIPSGPYRVRLYIGQGGETFGDAGDDYYRFVIWPVASTSDPPLLLYEQSAL